MSFDQGAWDAITALRNTQHRHNQCEDEEILYLAARVDELESRLKAMERRFTDMKKAVWKS